MPLKALSEVSRASVKAFPLSRWTWGRNYKNVARLNVTLLSCFPPPKYSFDIQFLVSSLWLRATNTHTHTYIHTRFENSFFHSIVERFIIISKISTVCKPRYTLSLLISFFFLFLSLFSSSLDDVHATQKARSNKEEKLNLNNRRKKNYCPITLPRAAPMNLYREAVCMTR